MGSGRTGRWGRGEAIMVLARPGATSNPRSGWRRANARPAFEAEGSPQGTSRRRQEFARYEPARRVQRPAFAGGDWYRAIVAFSLPAQVAKGAPNPAASLSVRDGLLGVVQNLAPQRHLPPRRVLLPVVGHPSPPAATPILAGLKGQRLPGLALLRAGAGRHARSGSSVAPVGEELCSATTATLVRLTYLGAAAPGGILACALPAGRRQTLDRARRGARRQACTERVLAEVDERTRVLLRWAGCAIGTRTRGTRTKPYMVADSI